MGYRAGCTHLTYLSPHRCSCSYIFPLLSSHPCSPPTLQAAAKHKQQADAASASSAASAAASHRKDQVSTDANASRDTGGGAGGGAGGEGGGAGITPSRELWKQKGGDARGLLGAGAKQADILQGAMGVESEGNDAEGGVEVKQLPLVDARGRYIPLMMSLKERERGGEGEGGRGRERDRVEDMDSELRRRRAMAPGRGRGGEEGGGGGGEGEGELGRLAARERSMVGGRGYDKALADHIARAGNKYKGPGDEDDFDDMQEGDGEGGRKKKKQK